MVTQKHGAEINKILAAEGSTLHANIFLSKHFHYNGQKDDIGGCFAAMTVPVKFARHDTVRGKKNRHRRPYTPKVGKRPPPDVLWPPMIEN